MALELLMMIEVNDADIDHRVEVYNRARAALVASGVPIGEMYPEFTTERVITEEQVEGSIDNSAGNWDFTSSTTDPREVEEVLAALQSMPMDLGDLPIGDEEGWV